MGKLKPKISWNHCLNFQLFRNHHILCIGRTTQKYLLCHNIHWVHSKIKVIWHWGLYRVTRKITNEFNVFYDVGLFISKSSALSSLQSTYCIVFRHAFSSDDNDDEDDDDDEGESQLQVNFFSFKTMYHLVSMLLFTSPPLPSFMCVHVSSHDKHNDFSGSWSGYILFACLCACDGDFPSSLCAQTLNQMHLGHMLSTLSCLEPEHLHYFPSKLYRPVYL